MTFEIDPFSQIYSAIYQYVAAQPGLLRITTAGGVVNPARFINLLEPVPNLKLDATSGAQTPDIILLQGNCILNPHGRNSLVASLVQDYIIAVTDSKDFISRLNRVKWLTFCALKNAPCNLGLEFVTGWQMLNGTDAMGPSRYMRAADRKWNTTATVRVQADIPKSLIP